MTINFPKISALVALLTFLAFLLLSLPQNFPSWVHHIIWVAIFIVTIILICFIVIKKKSDNDDEN